MPDYYTHFNISERDYAESRKGKYTIETKFNDLEKRELDGLIALECLKALSGMFTVLLMSDISRYFDENENLPIDSESFGNYFRYFGQLGLAITDECYARLFECMDGYEKLMKEGEHHK